MLQVTASPASRVTHCIAAPTAVPPKRGTPAYAAAVRGQIERLAALHAAAVAQDPSPPPIPTKSLLIVASCDRLRATVRDSLREVGWVRVLEARSAQEGQLMAERELPHLLLVDAPLQGMLTDSTVPRTVLIADVVPRSGTLPAQLVGVLARPLRAERVAQYLTALLQQAN